MFGWFRRKEEPLLAPVIEMFPTCEVSDCKGRAEFLIASVDRVTTKHACLRCTEEMVAYYHWTALTVI